jgi:DNA-binding MarR family transcriptional regulator
MASPNLDLAGYLPYLLNRAGSRIATSFSAVARDYGISLQMWRVLAALHHRDGQRIGDLADTTSIEVSTLSRAIGTMEGKGLVKRRRPGGDARTVTVHRTRAGIDLTDRMIPLAAHYEDVALAGFTADEAAMLKALLRRLYDNMAVLENERQAEDRAAG